MGLGRFNLMLVLCMAVLTATAQQIQLAPSAHIQLSLSQETYSPGDTVYFAARYYNDDLTVISGSHFLTIATFDEAGKDLYQTKIKITNGIGHGYIHFAEECTAGIYTILAYSNITSSRVFQKTIALVSSAYVIAQNPLTIYPEGGQLVDNFNNRIGIHSIQGDQDVVITDGSGDIIAETRVNEFGWASADVNVKKGAKYFVQYKDDASKVSLPNPSMTGFAVKMDGLDIDAKQINITAASDIVNQKCVLLVTSNNNVLFQSAFNYQSGSPVVRVIPKSILVSGLHQLYIIGSGGKTIGYREFYLAKENKVNAELSLSTKNYSTRMPVGMNLSLTDVSGNPLNAVGSMTVVNQSVVDDGGSNSGANHFGLMDMMHTESATAVNDYLIGQQSFSVSEDMSLNNTSSAFMKSGRAISKTTGEPLPEGAKILFYFLKSQNLALIKIDKGAEFGFRNVSDVYGSDDIFYLAEDFFGFEIDDVHIDWYTDRVVRPASSKVESSAGGHSNYATFNRNRKLIDQSFSVFENNESFNSNGNPDVDRFEANYFEADNVFTMSKYLRFPTMKETITEVIKPLSVSKMNGKDIIRINNVTAATTSSTPVYIIDGVPIKDTDYLLALNPGDLKEVRVYRDRKKLKRFGFLGRNGIIWFATKAGNAAPPIDPKNNFIAPQKALVFTPRPADNPSPTFESTIFWNPNLVIDSAGNTAVQFVTSDDVGEYLIRIEGITDGGQIFFSEQVIQVGIGEGSGGQ